MEENELHALVARHGLRVDQITGRAIERMSGVRATFGVTPDSRNDLFDSAKLDEMLERNGADFRGFIEARVFVPNRSLSALASDGLVFLADPSADEHLVSNPNHDFMPGVYWKLENLGLVPR